MSAGLSNNVLAPNFLYIQYRMDMFTQLFWLSSLLFIVLSGYLLCCTKRTPVFYAQILAGCGMFATSKIGRKFLGLD